MTSAYVVYSAPDDPLDPTVYHNGVMVEADDHEDAVLRRLDLVDGYGTVFGGFWVSGHATETRPDGTEHRRLELRKVKFRARSWEIVR